MNPSLALHWGLLDAAERNTAENANTCFTCGLRERGGRLCVIVVYDVRRGTLVMLLHELCNPLPYWAGRRMVVKFSNHPAVRAV